MPAAPLWYAVSVRRSCRPRLDAGIVVDYVTEIDANPELHATLRLDGGIAHCHLGLDRDLAFDRVHHAVELGENAVAGSVDDAPGELTNIGSTTA
jgi:hypothetical protein